MNGRFGSGIFLFASFILISGLKTASGQEQGSRPKSVNRGASQDHVPFLMTRIPYLQSPGPNSMIICWHDTAADGTKVEYGADSMFLNFSTPGTSEIVNPPYRWHCVKLTGLMADTRYFYRLTSGKGTTGIYSFKTLPGPDYAGKLRFLILGDTHALDTANTGKVIRAAKAKITDLFGPDIENQVNGIFHTGDIVISGDSCDQYSTKFFSPMSSLSPSIPTMVVAGNHEHESKFLYRYLKLDDQSAFPLKPVLNEKIWQIRIGNSLFIGMNTNITFRFGRKEEKWLDSILNTAEKDPQIDFVFLFFHHPPFSELWPKANTSDRTARYVRNALFPVIRKYTKVQELHYGHTHGFERGTVVSGKKDADFRIICGGGGGGDLDPWIKGENRDYNEIHITYNHYSFQILEIDIAGHSFQNSMHSLGNQKDPVNAECLDSWYKKKNQAGPDTPTLQNAEINEKYIQFSTSPFSGKDSIMSVQFRIAQKSVCSRIILDSVSHWKNIYGIDSTFKPADLNRDINLFRIKVKSDLFRKNRKYHFRFRYRDQNLKWSEWSDSYDFIRNRQLLPNR